MDRLQSMRVFQQVVDDGSFAAAARKFDMSAAVVTRLVGDLEDHLGVRLLHRTTHGLSLTDEGDTFLDYGRRLLDTSAELDSELTGKISGPSGWVRVTASPLMAEGMLAPSRRGRYQRYPQLHLDISADDRIADMARDGFDIALRSGAPNSDTVVARQIGTFGRTVCASPEYLHAHGTPTHPRDLEHHRLLTNSASPTLNRWAWTDPQNQGEGELQANGHTRADNTALLVSLVLQGLGIARIHDLSALPLIRQGRLVPILREYFVSPQVPIHAVILQERHRLPKIRACIDYWAEWMADGAKSGPSIPVFGFF